MWNLSAEIRRTAAATGGPRSSSSRPTTSQPARQVSLRPVAAEGPRPGQPRAGEDAGGDHHVHAHPYLCSHRVSGPVPAGAWAPGAGSVLGPGVLPEIQPPPPHPPVRVHDTRRCAYTHTDEPLSGGRARLWGWKCMMGASQGKKGAPGGIGFGKMVSESRLPPPTPPTSSLPAAPAAAGGTVLWWLQGARGPSLHTTQRPRRGWGE